MEYLTDNPLLSRLINSVKEFVIEQSFECDKYIGTLKNGKKSGYGKLIYKTGDIFEGEFDNDMRNGKGKMIYSKYDITLDGTWINDKKVGKGIFTWPNGSTLEVFWKE